MCDVILTLDLSSTDEDSLLSNALDAFVTSKVDAGRPARECHEFCDEPAAFAPCEGAVTIGQFRRVAHQVGLQVLCL